MIRKDHLRNVKARKVRLKQQGDYAQTRSEEYMRRKNRYPEKFQKVQCELCAKWNEEASENRCMYSFARVRCRLSLCENG